MAYNLFNKKPLMEAPQLTSPVQAFNPNGGSPDAGNIAAAYKTPSAQLQMLKTAEAAGSQSEPAVLPKIDRDDPSSGIEALASLYTSPEEEERMRKASVANRRILAIGDALRHIGNIYNTSRYAPSQKFNSPVAEEQQRYEKGKALRDAANYRYLSYQQARAAQDAKNRQWEATFNYNAARDAAKLNAQQEYWKNTLDERKRAADMANALGIRKADDAFKLGQERNRETERSHRVNEGLRRQRVGIAASNLALNREKFDWRRTNGGGGRGSNPYTYPTMNGYITLGRDLNQNRVGKKSLFDEMKRAGVIDSTWETSYNNMYDAAQQEALLNTAISQWLMRDPNAAGYMQSHFGAGYVPSGGASVAQTGTQAVGGNGVYFAPWNNPNQRDYNDDEDINWDDFEEQ